MKVEQGGDELLTLPAVCQALFFLRNVSDSTSSGNLLKLVGSMLARRPIGRALTVNFLPADTASPPGSFGTAEFSPFSFDGFLFTKAIVILVSGSVKNS